MATMSDMIDLRKFPKLGVRVPLALKRRAKQLALDLENEGVGFQGDEMTLEGIFAVAALELMAMDADDRRGAFERRVPELIAMFEKESPGESESPGQRVPGSQEIKSVQEDVAPRSGSRLKKRSGAD